MHRFAYWGCLVSFIVPTIAAGSTPEIDVPSTWHLIPLSELQDLRGGFITTGNVNIDLGFESIALIDGIVQSQHAWTLNMLAPPQAGKLSENGLDTGLPTRMLIQNQEDYRVIQTIQTLNIEMSNMGFLPGSQYGNMVNHHILHTLIP
jgi:hypothetical protein